MFVANSSVEGLGNQRVKLYQHKITRCTVEYHYINLLSEIVYLAYACGASVGIVTWSRAG
jgi:hypothetical protein